MVMHPPPRRHSRTKIIATLGPASNNRQRVAALVQAGVDIFRLNLAHAGPEEHQPHIEAVRALSDEMRMPIAVLADLGGPKIRLGELRDDRVVCELDDVFYFVDGEPRAANELTSTYAPLTEELDVGDRAMLADGSVTMVVEAKAPGRVKLRVVQRGIIRSRQGINVPGARLSVAAISATDREHAIWAARAGVDFIGLSFVRSPVDVRGLKEIVRSCGGTSRVVAKIEKSEALECLDEIVIEADAVMVARGDLGVEIDVAQMPVEQKRIIATCQRFQRPVIIATQMLDSMTDSPRPTRAEATDVANAILDGADACMLSGETAIGQYPVETVQMMNRIALATEASIQHRPPRQVAGESAVLHDITRAVVRAAGQMAYDLGAKLIFVASHSGRTALAVSQHRSFVPTIGVSSSEETRRQMCLYWGVTPLRGAPACDMQQLIKHADAWACRAGYATPGDRIVIVGGSHLAAGPEGEAMSGGVHDVVLVHEVEGETEM